MQYLTFDAQTGQFVVTDGDRQQGFADLTEALHSFGLEPTVNVDTMATLLQSGGSFIKPRYSKPRTIRLPDDSIGS